MKHRVQVTFVFEVDDANVPEGAGLDVVVDVIVGDMAAQLETFEDDYDLHYVHESTDITFLAGGK